MTVGTCAAALGLGGGCARPAAYHPDALDLMRNMIERLDFCTPHFDALGRRGRLALADGRAVIVEDGPPRQFHIINPGAEEPPRIVNSEEIP